MDMKSQQKYIDSLINPAIAYKIANRNEGTQEKSHNSLLETTSDEIPTTTDETNKNSRQEYINSIAKAAITKTITNKKGNSISTPDPKGLAGKGKVNITSTPDLKGLAGEQKENTISTPDPKGLAGEGKEEEKEKQNGVPKVRKIKNNVQRQITSPK